MSETTKGKNVPEALRMIAGWIEEGREVEEWRDIRGKWVSPPQYMSLLLGKDKPLYRAKPRKPCVGFAQRVYQMGAGTNLDAVIADNIDVIAFTPEVRERCADLLEDV